MATPNNIFSYMYEVELKHNGSFVLKDFDKSKADGITPVPVGTGVSLSDNINDPVLNGGSDNQQLLGDAINDHFTLTAEGGLASKLNGSYSYVSLALTSDASGPTDTSHAGFIAQAGTNYYYITNNLITLPATSSRPLLTLKTESGDTTICFMPDTHIRTPAGDIAIEDLSVGDLVLTHDGRCLPVRWIGRQTIAGRFTDERRLPIRIREGALGGNVPCRDLLVSSDHALLVDDVLINAGALINGTSIVRERAVPVIFTYNHVELDDHSLVIAENTPAETFVDNVDRSNFDNWREYEALYPDGKAVVEMAYPRAKSCRQIPRAIREKLMKRAISLYGSQAAFAA
jgi:hypothetical protein